MAYFTNWGPVGALKYRDVPGALGVLLSRDAIMPAGEAHCTGWDDDGLALFTLIVDKKPIPGQWRLVNQEFIAVDGACRRPISEWEPRWD